MQGDTHKVQFKLLFPNSQASTDKKESLASYSIIKIFPQTYSNIYILLTNKKRDSNTEIDKVNEHTILMKEIWPGNKSRDIFQYNLLEKLQNAN